MYTNYYDTNEIRNVEYNLIDLVKPFYKQQFDCLDLGCGSCRKIIPLLKYVNTYYAVDIDSKRIEQATKLINHHNYRNIIVGVADNFYLPFENARFDLVSCFMTKCNFSEVKRVLRKDGIFILETVGAEDKLLFKEKFGKDKLGWRGRIMNETSDEYILRLKSSLAPFFDLLQFNVIKFNTKLTSNAALNLFNMTSDIRNFNVNSDKNILKMLEDPDGFINYQEEKLVIICRNKTEIN